VVNRYSALPPLFRHVKGPQRRENAVPSADVGALPASAQLPLLPEPRHIDAYRAALRQCWQLMAAGAAANPDACRQALSEVVRFEDEVGEPRATDLRHQWEIEWSLATGRCPRCGEPGERHE
jgi:hypothetical protein